MKTLVITKKEGVATVVIDNPPVNILTADLIDELNSFLCSLKNDVETKIVIFKSFHAKFFIAHLDLNIINGTPEGRSVILEFSHLIKNIKEMKQLSIAYVDGVARGGGNEFVMACDLSYGTENSNFAQPEIGVNIPTGGQGAVQFARRMGKGKALEALLTGVDFTAEEAEQLNIITKYIPKTDIDAYLNGITSIIRTFDLDNIVMYKNIINTSIKDEDAGAGVELRYFFQRARLDKTQAIIKAFLNNGGQTEREADDIQGIFADTVKELSE
ncbi:enoyl-CoA hydratase/isomerase family protein [Flagellimonas sp. 2504JD4-2]